MSYKGAMKLIFKNSWIEKRNRDEYRNSDEEELSYITMKTGKEEKEDGSTQLNSKP